MNTNAINKTIEVLTKVQRAQTIFRQDHPNQRPLDLFRMETWGENLPDDDRDLELFINHGIDNLCNTAGCLAGWASVAAGDRVNRPQYIIRDDAQAFLGLSDAEADQLFIPRMVRDETSITAVQAVQVLEILRDTCQVDWEAVIPEEHLTERID